MPDHAMPALTTPDRPAFTARAFAIGIACCLVTGVAPLYSNMVQKSSYLAGRFLSLIVVFLLVVIVLFVNTLLKAVRMKWGLSAGELVLITIMSLVSSCIPTFGLTEQTFPLVVGPLYFASPENKWETIFHPHIRSWLVPSDPEAVRWFFEGLPAGERIPWAAWVVPVFFWLMFLFALYFVLYCIMIILRRQWIERERLPFPLMAVPMEMVKGEESSPRTVVNAFFKNRLMWIGFAIPVIINIFNSVPGLPSMSKTIPIRTPVFYLALRWDFPWFGVAYLLSLDTLFSLWFFCLAGKIIQGVCARLGITMTGGRVDMWTAGGPVVGNIGFGALVMFVLIMLYNSRPHLRDVVRKTFGKGGDVDDSNELLSYPVAFWGTVLGTVYIVCWLWQSGMTLGVAVTMVLLSLIVFLGLTRIVAEGGLLYAQAPMVPQVAIIRSMHPTTLGLSNLTALGMTVSWMAETRTIIMGAFANSLKLADEYKLRNKRKLSLAIAAAVVVTTASSIWCLFFLAYRHGGFNLNRWFFQGNVTWPSRYLTSVINAPEPSNLYRWVSMASGAAAIGFLTLMRYTFAWWPLHPLGLPLANSWPVAAGFFGMFVVWIIKSLILRLGGIALYRKFIPFFLGLIVGELFGDGVWFIIDVAIGRFGHVLIN